MNKEGLHMAHWIQRVWGHFKTITRHRHAVIRHSMTAGILWQGLHHDLSKYSPSEFWVGVKYYSGHKSPNEQERQLYGYSAAWLHHKGRNKHHFEYWNDYDPVTHQVRPVPMPMRYVAEMFCDRVAASKIYQGDAYSPQHPLAYFLKGKETRPIHPQTSDQLEELVRILADRGEAAAFARLRQMLRQDKQSHKRRRRTLSFVNLQNQKEEKS